MPTLKIEEDGLEGIIEFGFWEVGLRHGLNPGFYLLGESGELFLVNEPSAEPLRFDDDLMGLLISLMVVHLNISVQLMVEIMQEHDVLRGKLD